MGRSWYEDGKMLNKKNTFKDFISVGKYLVANNYTSKSHLYAYGGSAGGLLIGAVINMEPELFNGVIINPSQLYILLLHNHLSLVLFKIDIKLELIKLIFLTRKADFGYHNVFPLFLLIKFFIKFLFRFKFILNWLKLVIVFNLKSFVSGWFFIKNGRVWKTKII